MRPLDGGGQARNGPVIDDVVGRIADIKNIVVNEVPADLIFLIEVVINLDQVLRLVVVSQAQVAEVAARVSQQRCGQRSTRGGGWPIGDCSSDGCRCRNGSVRHCGSAQSLVLLSAKEKKFVAVPVEMAGDPDGAANGVTKIVI